MDKRVLFFVLFVALIVVLNRSGLVTKDALLDRLKENKNWLRQEAGISGFIAVVRKECDLFVPHTIEVYGRLLLISYS